MLTRSIISQYRLNKYCSNPPKMLKKPLVKNEPIAYVSSTALGDTIVSLVTVNNLIRNGYQLDVYSDYAYELRDWFPTMKIMPAVPLDEQQKKLAKYSTILHMYPFTMAQDSVKWCPQPIIFSVNNPLVHFLIHMVEMQAMFCRYQLELSGIELNNGMQPPKGLVLRKYKNRIIIHPTSSYIVKNWPPQKFMELARALRDRGYDICFIVAKKERGEWEKIINNEFKLPNFDSLSDIAAYFYESGYFIGNDSGIGHLASSVGLPTVSITVRKSVVIRWRPFWAPNESIVVAQWLNPRQIREKLWKQFISVKKVLAGFDRLVARV